MMLRLPLTRLATCAFLFAVLSGPVFGQESDTAPLPSPTEILASDEMPLDPAVTVGKLDNGLTYYIRPNQRPENRAELRLVVNAGSILENDDQLGLAHFLEHMLFNGTKSFEKQELIDYLESVGMRMGPDLNAYTSFDETVYMLQIPTDSTELVDTAFQIMKEWTSDALLEGEEIDKERGVVIEEWRGNRGAGSRILDKQFPVLLNNSRYAERLPIGTVEVLESFDHETLRQFYRDWYRPDLMAVVAVGDFDPAAIEALIKEKFSLIPSAQNAPDRTVYNVPDHEETLLSIVTDPEATSGSIRVVYKHDLKDDSTPLGYTERFTERLYNNMLNDRLSELTQDTDPPFIFGFSGLSEFARTKEFYNLGASPRDDSYLRALESVLIEAERVKQHGFTQSELDRMKTEMLRFMERAYNERDKTNSSGYAAEYVRNFLTGEPSPGIAYEYALMQAVLPSITLVQVNALATEWIADDSRVITLSGPEKEGFDLPSEEEVLAVFDRVASMTIDAYEENVSEAPLVANIPEPGTIIEESYNETLDVTRLSLSNGIKVVLKPTDFKNDQILMRGTSPGGLSLVSDDIYTSASFASTLIGQSGFGEFGPIELQKKLAGKVAGVSPSISSLSEGISGSASPADLETLFQLTHLSFTAPRADEVAYQSFITRLGAFLQNQNANPAVAYRDTLSNTMTQNHPRRLPLTQDQIDEVSLATAFEVYKDRFADASDFTFYFVGNFDVEGIKPYLTTYLATLPSINREENWQDEGVRPPKGVIQKAVYRGLEPKSQIQIIFSGESEWSQHTRRLVSAMGQVLNLKLREVLREDLGGTYGVGVNASQSRTPYENYRVAIGFGCDPERAEELITSVFEQIDLLKAEAPDETYLTKVREASIRQHETALKENGTWLSSLQFYDQTELDPNTILEGAKPFYDELTPAMIQEAAQRYLDIDNYVQVVLLPEEAASTEGSGE